MEQRSRVWKGLETYHHTDPCPHSRTKGILWRLFLFVCFFFVRFAFTLKRSLLKTWFCVCEVRAFVKEGGYLVETCLSGLIGINECPSGWEIRKWRSVNRQLWKSLFSREERDHWTYFSLSFYSLGPGNHSVILLSLLTCPQQPGSQGHPFPLSVGTSAWLFASRWSQTLPQTHWVRIHLLFHTPNTCSP